MEATLEVCNQVLGRGECVASADPPRGEWSALITWSDAEQRLAHVRFSRQGFEGSDHVTRDVEFGSADPLEQRLRAVGLVIAAYVIASSRSYEDEVPETPERDQATPKPLQSFDSPFPEDRSGWGIDAAALLGGSLSGAPPSWGAAFKPWWRPFSPPLLALGQLRWRTSERDLHIDWLSFSLGLALRIETPSAPFRIELRSEATAERVTLRARDITSARSEQASLWRLGARAGADVFVSLSDEWAIFVGGDANLLRPRLIVDVAGEPQGREPRLSLQGLAGIRWQRP